MFILYFYFSKYLSEKTTPTPKILKEAPYTQHICGKHLDSNKLRDTTSRRPYFTSLSSVSRNAALLTLDTKDEGVVHQSKNKMYLS